MKKAGYHQIVVLALCLWVIPLHSAGAAINEPVLKWDNGGCTHWCMTGWYGSPAVADLDGNGTAEVIYASYKVWVLDGATGAVYWEVYTGHDRNYTGSEYVGRTWASPVIADIDADGIPEIVTGHSQGWISVYDIQGFFKPGWPVQAAPSSEIRTLAAYDLEKDGDMEIFAASTSSGDDEEWYVFEHDGSLRSGWPQHSGDCYAAGCFNQNIAIADIDQNDLGEIIGPNDTHYICAFTDRGDCIPAHPMYGGRYWGQVGVWVDLEAEIRGWGYCGMEHRPNFCHSAPVIADLDGNGSLEIVVVGNVHNCETSPYTDLYEVPLIFHPDRSRFHSGTYDWTVLPAPPSEGAWAPLSQDWEVIENCQPNPSLADVDADGVMEIFYPAYDGCVHGFKLDKTEFGNWPYAVTQPGENVIRFASEVVAADLDGNGSVEILFGSWTQKSSGQTGKLHVLTGFGDPIFEVPLPQEPGEWNGILGAPTLADIDADGELELVAGTAATGVVAYDLPGAVNSDILWGTSRSNYLRNGSIETPLPSLSVDITTNKDHFYPGDELRIGLGLVNPRNNINCDLYLFLWIYGIPLFITPDPAWPSFSANPYAFPLRPLPGGFEMDPVELFILPLGYDPLPPLIFDWFAILTGAGNINILAIDSARSSF